MWRLKNKRGFALVEVLCSLIIISLLVNTTLILMTNCLRIHSENMNKQKYINFMEALSKEIEWNFSYEDIIQLKNSRNFYIDRSHINENVLKSSDFKEIFSSSEPLQKPYIEMSVIEGDILTLNVNLCYMGFNKEENMSMRLFKGRYR